MNKTKVRARKDPLLPLAGVKPRFPVPETQLGEFDANNKKIAAVIGMPDRVQIACLPRIITEIDRLSPANRGDRLRMARAVMAKVGEPHFTLPGAPASRAALLNILNWPNELPYGANDSISEKMQKVEEKIAKIEGALIQLGQVYKDTPGVSKLWIMEDGRLVGLDETALQHEPTRTADSEERPSDVQREASTAFLNVAVLVEKHKVLDEALSALRRGDEPTPRFTIPVDEKSALKRLKDVEKQLNESHDLGPGVSDWLVHERFRLEKCVRAFRSAPPRDDNAAFSLVALMGFGVNVNLPLGAQTAGGPEVGLHMPSAIDRKKLENGKFPPRKKRPFFSFFLNGVLGRAVQFRVSAIEYIGRDEKADGEKPNWRKMSRNERVEYVKKKTSTNVAIGPIGSGNHPFWGKTGTAVGSLPDGLIFVGVVGGDGQSDYVGLRVNVPLFVLGQMAGVPVPPHHDISPSVSLLCVISHPKAAYVTGPAIYLAQSIDEKINVPLKGWVVKQLQNAAKAAKEAPRNKIF